METDNAHDEMRNLLRENNELLHQNQRLLKKIHRNGLIEFWVRLMWYILLIGFPFAIYFYVLEPYFTAMGSSYELFSAGMQEIPGFKQFMEALEQSKRGN
jgi:hypothetical protein